MNKILKFLLLLSLVLLISSCSKYYRFDELYDKGEYLNAYNILEQIKDKKNVYYQKRLFRIVIKLALDGDTDFIQILKNISTNVHYKEVDNYVYFSQVYNHFLEARNPRQYLVIINSLSNIRNAPEEFSAYAYKLRGISYYKTGSYQLAINDLNQSFKLSPYIDNLYFIGMAYFDLEEQKQSASYFNKIINSTHNNFFKSLAYFQLGEINYYQNKYPEALEEYLNAINHYSHSADYAYKVAKCMQNLKYSIISQKFLKISLRIQKDYANAWFFLNIN